MCFLGNIAAWITVLMNTLISANCSLETQTLYTDVYCKRVTFNFVLLETKA